MAICCSLCQKVPLPKCPRRQNVHVPECLRSQKLHRPNCPRDEKSFAEMSGGEVFLALFDLHMCKSMFKTVKCNPLNEGLLTEDFFSIIYKVKSSFDAS